MIIRPETEADQQTIYDLTKEAFEPMPFADGTEAQSINNLRANGDLTLSLVAEDKDVIGHIAFSPAKVAADQNWIGLGPISVAKKFQRKGIGTQLTRAGLIQVKQLGYKGCVLIGNPAVYGPMGFAAGGITYRELDPALVQYVAFGSEKPIGEVKFADALE